MTLSCPSLRGLLPLQVNSLITYNMSCLELFRALLKALLKQQHSPASKWGWGMGGHIAWGNYYFCKVESSETVLNFKSWKMTLDIILITDASATHLNLCHKHWLCARPWERRMERTQGPWASRMWGTGCQEGRALVAGWGGLEITGRLQFYPRTGLSTQILILKIHILFKGSVCSTIPHTVIWHLL